MLSKNHLQAQDDEFFKILSRVRQGSSTENDIKRINDTGKLSPSAPRTHTILCLRNFEVEEVNRAELRRIPGRDLRSTACDTYKTDPAEELMRRVSDAAPRTVIVKAGCAIILTRRVGSAVPGTRARVLSVHHYDPISEDGSLLYLYVGMGDVQRKILISPIRFDICRADGNTLAWRKQLPIFSAYALTVHRSQGLTLQRVAMDFRKVSTWIPAGMAYVALSRCTSLQGLWVRELQKKHIVVSEHARRLMKDNEKLKRHFVHRVINSITEIRKLCGTENEPANQAKKRTIDDEILNEEPVAAAKISGKQYRASIESYR